MNDLAPQASIAAHERATDTVSSTLPLWHPRRLPVRVAGAGALLLATVIGLFTWVTVQDERAMGQLAAERQVHAIAHNLAAASASALAEQSYAEIDRIVRRMLAFPEVQRISVLDAANRVLVDLARGPGGRPVLTADSSDVRSPPKAASLREANDALVLWLPIEEDRPLGWVRVEQSLAAVHTLTQRIVRDGVLLGLVAVMLAVFLFVLYVRREMRGIEHATAFAAGLDAARGMQQVIRPGPYEAEALAQALNQVSTRLAEQQRELAASTRRLRAVLDNAVDGIFTVDGRGILTDVNPAAARLFGYDQDEMRGQPIRDFVPRLVLDESADDDPLPRLSDGTFVLKRDFTGRRRNGNTVPLQLGLSEIQFDDTRLYVGIVRDVTEERRLEQMKNSFIAQVSHELRTPLTSLNAALALMGSDAQPREARRLVEIAHSSSARLTRLVGDILDYERLESGSLVLNISAIELAPVVQAAVVEERPRADALGVSIRFVKPLPEARVLADPERLRQAIGKLLDNAVRMSPHGEPVRVSVERRKNLLQIGVTDRGPGVPESFRPQAFGKFAQVDSTDERYRHGPGLGLSLARAIVERLGGNIDYYSVPGVETKFFIELPEIYDGGGSEAQGE